jgi:hypothetical protein
VRGVQFGLTSLLFVLAGCGGGVAVAPQPSWAAWAGRAGGVASGPEQVRSEAALSRLAAEKPWPVSVHLLANDALGAWTFPDGNIFVTRGLVTALSDDELAAVLAHETGHLRAAGRLPRGVAFDGAAGPTGCEERADDEGCALLKCRGIAKASLASALLKVRNATSTSPLIRAALDLRIRRLTLAQIPVPPGSELLHDLHSGV